MVWISCRLCKFGRDYPLTFLLEVVSGIYACKAISHHNNQPNQYPQAKQSLLVLRSQDTGKVALSFDGASSAPLRVTNPHFT